MRMTAIIRRMLYSICLALSFFATTNGQDDPVNLRPSSQGLKRVQAHELLKRAVKQVEPIFPSSVTSALLYASGKKLVVEVTVNEEGKVVDAKFVSGASLLSDAAVEAAKAWEFVPSKSEGLSRVVGPLIFKTPREIYGWIPHEFGYYLAQVKKEPDSWIAQCNLAKAYRPRNLPLRAVEAYNKAISLNPRAAIAFQGLGVIYCFDLKQYEKALEAYQQAAKIQPDFIEAHIGAAGMLERFDKYEQAVEIWSKVMKLSPDLGTKEMAYFNLSSIYQKMFRRQESIEALKQLIRVKRDMLAVDPALQTRSGIAMELSLLASAYEEIGSDQEAIGTYQQAVEINPNTQSEWEASLAIARIHKKRGDEALALAVYQRLLDKVNTAFRSDRPRENYTYAHYSRGELFEKMGRDKEAIEEYKKAAALRADWIKPHVALYYVYRRGGDNAAADREYAIIKKHDDQLVRDLRERSDVQK